MKKKSIIFLFIVQSKYKNCTILLHVNLYKFKFVWGQNLKIKMQDDVNQQKRYLKIIWRFQSIFAGEKLNQFDNKDKIKK